MPRRFAVTALLVRTLLAAHPGAAGELGYSDVNPYDTRMLIYEGKAEEAIEQARSAIAELRPPKNTIIARRIGMFLTHICDAHTALGQYEEGESACLEAVTTFEEAAKQDALSDSYNYELYNFGLPQLAVTYEQAGKWEAALEVRQRLLSLLGGKQGYARERIELLRNIGELHLQLGDHQAAEASYLGAIASIDEIQQSEREVPLLTYSRLAAVYQLEERFDKAEATLLQGLTQLRAISVADSFYTTLLSEALAWTYYYAGRLEEARNAAMGVLQFHTRRGDGEHWFASTAKVLLARIEDAERPGSPEAERLFNSAIAAPESDSGMSQTVRAIAKTELARHHLLREQFAVAEPLALEGAESLGWLLGETHFQTARAEVCLAQALQGQGKPEEALAAAQTAYAAQREALPPYHSETGETLALLAELYEVLGQRENLAATRTLLDEYQAQRKKFEQAN